MNQLNLFLACWAILFIFYMILAGGIALVIGHEPNRKQWLGMALVVAAVSVAQLASSFNP